MNTKTIVAIATILAVLGAGYALAGPNNAGFWNSMMGGYGIGGGMMANYGSNSGYGPGSGMMGYGDGHCRDYGTSTSIPGVNAVPLTIEKAKEAVEEHIKSTGNEDFALSEVMEFGNHFYAEVKEKSTGVHAFELLVNRYSGVVTPEPGPNMMWNTRYGHMSTGGADEAAVTKEQALGYAQDYLDKALPGTRADDAEAFYGYYTLHVLKDGRIYGMLSVNSMTGAVWYHRWHREFIKMLEVE